MVFFISDLHLGHSNIIKLCKRPFESVEDMDSTLIKNWNHKVGKTDTVYIVGDFVWDKKTVAQYVEQLKGNKILIVGNHDDHWIKEKSIAKYFKEIVPYYEANLNCHPITLCHYPMLEWKSSRKEGSQKLGYLIHGHIHNNILSRYQFLFHTVNALNAGVDINHFEPVPFDELVENNARFKENALTILKSTQELPADSGNL